MKGVLQTRNLAEIGRKMKGVLQTLQHLQSHLPFCQESFVKTKAGNNLQLLFETHMQKYFKQCCQS
jgi:hypothetical protein